MISFKVLNEENRIDVTEGFCELLSKDAYELLIEITDGFSFEDDMEFAVAVYSDCLLVRVFDMGKYLFLYPYELTECADAASALKEISEYAVREEIPLVFSDVPSECLSCFSLFRHMDIDAVDKDAQSFQVKIKTECMLLDEIPEIDEGSVKLSPITEADIPLYAELSRSQNVNKYWGYDYSDDVNEPSDGYFYDMAVRDFDFGIAMSLAIRCEGSFCGEAVLYAFDGLGGAEFAIRLLPDFQGRGLGRCTVRALMSLAEKIGLVKLYSVIMKENEKSLAMLDSVTDEKYDLGESVRYAISI